MTSGLTSQRYASVSQRRIYLDNLLAATIRQKLRIEVAVMSSFSTLPLDQPVLTLSL